MIRTRDKHVLNCFNMHKGPTTTASLPCEFIQSQRGVLVPASWSTQPGQLVGGGAQCAPTPHTSLAFLEREGVEVRLRVLVAVRLRVLVAVRVRLAERVRVGVAVRLRVAVPEGLRDGSA